MVTTPVKRKATVYYPALDGLRALAVLIVFWQHYLIGKAPIYNWGWLGVDIFFVISGFLITGILFDSRQNAHRFRDFYARRMLRILPLYYGIALALLLTKPFFHWWTPKLMLYWVLHIGNLVPYFDLRPLIPEKMDLIFTRTKGVWNTDLRIGHFWSLCVEEQFYLVWPLIVFTSRSRKILVTICTASVVLCPLLRTVASFTVPQIYLSRELLYKFTPLRVDALLIGALVALLMRGPEREWLHRHGRKLAIFFMSLFAVCVAVYTGVRGVGANLSDHLLPTIGFTVVDLFSVGLVLELIQNRGVSVKAMQWKPLKLLGTVSYGFYVFHDMFHDVYIRVAVSLNAYLHLQVLDWLIAFIGLMCTVVLASLSYRLYEKPFLRLKSRFSSQTHLAPRI